MGIDSIITNNSLPKVAGSEAKAALGKDDFLKLMLTQMQHQDPLQPMDNQQMVSQMAQFSSLEQMANMNKNFEKSQASAAFMDATRLLGKQVLIADPNAPPESGSLLSVKVLTVSSTAQGPVLTTQGGQQVTMDQILSVSEPN